MKRFVTVFSPIAMLAAFSLGAAPSKQTTKDVGATVPSATAAQPESPASVAGNGATELVAPNISAQPIRPEAAATAATYEIDWYSINGGGTTNATSTNYRMGASIGQSVAGAASSPSYQMGIGFWYGASGGGGCACDCHNDPICDGTISNAQDVVATINVAFRGAAALIDPNANCPYEQSDVNCDAVTGIQDVVRVVNVAFRGLNAATEYCNACP